MYKVRLYYNTGFNSINIPDSPKLLDGGSFDYADFPALDILQHYFLASVKIKATYSEVINADYLKLYSDTDSSDYAYYSVNSVTMRSVDVAQLAIVQDSILSVGGIDAFTINGGITSRHHVVEDKFGEYDEDDDMLVPSQPLEVNYALGVYEQSSAAYKEYFNLSISGKPATTPLFYSQGSTPYMVSSIAFEDFDIEDSTVTGYNLQVVSEEDNSITSIQAPGAKNTSGKLYGGAFKKFLGEYNEDTGSTDEDGTRYGDYGTSSTITYPYSVYNYNNTDAIKTAQSIHGWGLDDAIIDCYALPSNMVKGDISTAGRISDLSTRIASVGTTPFTKIKDDSNTNDYHSDSDKKYSEIQNQRIYYGSSYKRVLLCPATGNSIELNPEEFFPVGSDLYDGYIYVRGVFDIRPGGKPIYNFLTTKRPQNMYVNSICGAEWRSVPVRYTGLSGYELNAEQQRLTNSYNDIKSSSDYIGMMGGLEAYGNIPGMSLRSTVNAGITGIKALGAAGIAAATGGSALTAGLASLSGSSSGSSSSLNTLLNLYEAQSLNSSPLTTNEERANMAALGNTVLQSEMSRKLEKNYETAQFNLSNSYKAPTVNFMPSPTLRDSVSNGCMCFQYSLTTADQIKFNKILNAYGYRHTTVMEDSFLRNRKYHNYVEAAGVSIISTSKTKIPKMLREDIMKTFANGVRIWHTKPDDPFASNPVAS